MQPHQTPMNHTVIHETSQVAPHLNIKSSIFSGMEYLICGDARTYHMKTERDSNFGWERISLAVNYLSGKNNSGREEKIFSLSLKFSVLNMISQSCRHSQYFSHSKLHKIHRTSNCYTL